MKPAVYYFQIRGRGEPIKLLLAAKGIEFDAPEVQYQDVKSDLDKYQFGQLPRYADEDVDISQSNTIMRHLGRNHGMYGKDVKEAAAVDMILDGIEDIKRKYLALIYQDQLGDEAKQAYWSTHCDPATAIGARNNGAHFEYCRRLVARFGAGGWAVGDSLSIADIMLWDIVDLHLRIFEEPLRAAYPELLAHYEKIKAIPGVAKYLESPQRLPKVNNNGLG